MNANALFVGFALTAFCHVFFASILSARSASVRKSKTSRSAGHQSCGTHR